ncbi:hypothetical protein JL720_8642 [Aureococcus anophagefferens]|nr:hypothetical protein JL720_8642 [Aureococcus anophagefferens]
MDPPPSGLVRAVKVVLKSLASLPEASAPTSCLRYVLDQFEGAASHGPTARASTGPRRGAAAGDGRRRAGHLRPARRVAPTARRYRDGEARGAVTGEFGGDAEHALATLNPRGGALGAAEALHRCAAGGGAAATGPAPPRRSLSPRACLGGVFFDPSDAARVFRGVERGRSRTPRRRPTALRAAAVIAATPPPRRARAATRRREGRVVAGAAALLAGGGASARSLRRGAAALADAAGASAALADRDARNRKRTAHEHCGAAAARGLGFRAAGVDAHDWGHHAPAAEDGDHWLFGPRGDPERGRARGRARPGRSSRPGTAASRQGHAKHDDGPPSRGELRAPRRPTAASAGDVVVAVDGAAVPDAETCASLLDGKASAALTLRRVVDDGDGDDDAAAERARAPRGLAAAAAALERVAGAFGVAERALDARALAVLHVRETADAMRRAARPRRRRREARDDAARKKRGGGWALEKLDGRRLDDDEAPAAPLGLARAAPAALGSPRAAAAAAPRLRDDDRDNKRRRLARVVASGAASALERELFEASGAAARTRRPSRAPASPRRFDADARRAGSRVFPRLLRDADDATAAAAAHAASETNAARAAVLRRRLFERRRPSRRPRAGVRRRARARDAATVAKVWAAEDAGAVVYGSRAAVAGAGAAAAVDALARLRWRCPRRGRAARVPPRAPGRQRAPRRRRPAGGGRRPRRARRGAARRRRALRTRGGRQGRARDVRRGRRLRAADLANRAGAAPDEPSFGGVAEAVDGAAPGPLADAVAVAAAPADAVAAPAVLVALAAGRGADAWGGGTLRYGAGALRSAKLAEDAVHDLEKLRRLRRRRRRRPSRSTCSCPRGPAARPTRPA